MTRQDDARQKRRNAADIAFDRPHFGPEPHPIPNTQTMEDTFPKHIANYSKGLIHDANLGEVDDNSYQSLLDALISGNPADFEQIMLDTSFSQMGERGNKKLTNPLSGLAFDLEGPDAHAIALLKQGATPDLTDPNNYEPFPLPPKLDSEEIAGEMVELYWMALLRDVDFTDYSNNNLVQEAADELSNLTVFKGPKENGRITPQTLFRGFAHGDTDGPYISQLLLRGNEDDVLGREEIDGWVKYGTQSINQQIVAAVEGKDFGTTLNSWKAIQNGENRDLDPLYQGKKGDNRKLRFFFDETQRFIRNPRDIATYVHYDALYQAYQVACLYLLRKMDFEGDQMLNPGNPYIGSSTMAGFGTFGGPHILSLVCEVATRALKSVWYTKWFLFRHLRPEAYGGLVHLHKTQQTYPQLHSDVIDSGVLDRIKRHNNEQNIRFKRLPRDGTYLLPLAFPEGSPTHPSYGAGHATVAGACVTILKAWFKEDYEFEKIYVPKSSGKKLEKIEGRLKLEGELNKLAANIAIGRNMAGVHWRSDYTQSLRLGEAIAIGILEEQKILYKEMFTQPFEFNRFDGTRVFI
jgi:hypothetical protein